MIRLIFTTLVLLAGGIADAQAGDNTYTTSWIGNTFGRKDMKWVQNQILDLRVESDGTCFTHSMWDECAREAGIYKNGDVVTSLGLFNVHQYRRGAAVTSNATYIWHGVDWEYGKIRRSFRSNGSPANMTGGVDDGANLDIATGIISGLAATNTKLFVSDSGANTIKVYDPATMAFIQEWSVPRPGQLALDAQGNLWVISNGGFTSWFYGEPSVVPKILRYSQTGTKLAQEITGLQFPRGLAIDNQNRLLVGVNGSVQQVYTYSGIDSTPTLASALGTLGGMPGGTVPCEVTPTKFQNITGVGADGSGNVYVAFTGLNNDVGTGAVLRSFNSSGILNWEVLGLEFIDCAAPDSGTDGLDLYTKQEHFVMDYSKPAGQQWTWKGYTLDIAKYPNDWRQQALHHMFGFEMRRVNGRKFLYTHDIDYNHLGICRFPNDLGSNEETAVPAVYISGGVIDTDLNGNGQMESGIEQRSFPVSQKIHGKFVDENGGIWMATEFCWVYYFPCKGVLPNGVPKYDDTPALSLYVSPDFNVLGRVSYIASTDTLYVGGFNPSYPVNGQYSNFQVIKKYQGVLAGGALPAASWTLVASANNSGKSMYADEQYVFVCDVNPAHIRCYKASDATLVNTIQPGPEVGSTQGWVDIPNALKAFRRSNGEYLILQEEDAFAKVLMYRWQAPSTNTSVPSAPTDLAATVNSSSRMTLSWTDNSTNEWGFKVERKIGSGGSYVEVGIARGNSGTYGADCLDVPPGTRCYFRIRSYNDQGASAYTSEVNGTTHGLPTVTLTSPSTNQSFSGPATVSLAANATAPGGTVAKVEFFRGATKLGEDTTSPYTFSWTNAPAGFYSITAKVTSSNGDTAQSASAAITITGDQILIGSTFGDAGWNDSARTIKNNNWNPGPEAAFDGDINTFANGGLYGTTFGIDLGLDNQATVSKIRFYPRASTPGRVNGGLFQGSTDNVNFTTLATASANAAQWYEVNSSNTTTAYRYLRYVAPDGSYGNIAEIEFHSNLTAVNQAPTCSLTSPSNGTDFTAGATASLAATASDSGGAITKVEFYADDTLLETDTTSPYTGSYVNLSTGSRTLTARAYDNRGAVAVSDPVLVTIQAQSPSQAETPFFTPLPGTYNSTQSVTIGCATSGATIRYTTDGTTPSPSNGAIYSTPVSISSTTVLKAIAYHTEVPEMAASNVSTANYVIDRTVTAPVLSPAAGVFDSTQSVAISSATIGATIRYTTDGSTPGATHGTVYSGPVTISETTTLKAIAYKTEMNDSVVTSGSYIIDRRVAAPAFSVPPGIYISAQTIAISSTTSGAAIRYTTDGSTPTATSGTVYAGPVTIGNSSTFKAIAFKSGMIDSSVTTATYTITNGNPGFTWTGIQDGSWTNVGNWLFNGVAASRYPGAGNDGDVVFFGSRGTNPGMPTTNQGRDDRVSSLTFQDSWDLNLGSRWFRMDGISVSIPGSDGTTRVYGGGGLQSYSGTIYFNAAAGDTLALDCLFKPINNGNRTHGFSGGGVVAVNGGFDNDGKTISYIVRGNTTLLNNHYMNSVGLNTGSLSVDSGSVAGGDGAFQVLNSTVNGAVSPTGGGNANTGTGTLHFNGSLVLNGTYLADISGASCDKLATSGVLTLGTSSRLNINGPATADSYVLASYTSRVGTFDVANSAWPAGYLLDYAFEGNQIALVKQTGPVQAPVFSPAAGTYTAAQLVTLSSGTHGAVIRYTTDGSNPTASGGMVYGTPLQLTTSTTLKAMAFVNGMADSTVSTAAYAINIPVVAIPVITPAGGSFTTAQTVTISCDTSAATIRYTTDNSTPSATNGAIYSEPLTFSFPTTLKVIAHAVGMIDSAVNTQFFNINIPVVASPSFSPPAGTYASAQAVTLSSATSDAVIRYTTDGSTPGATHGTVYVGPVNVGVATTLKAIAYQNGMFDSAVTSGAYTITSGNLGFTWIGATDRNWTTLGNWLFNGTPASRYPGNGNDGDVVYFGTLGANANHPASNQTRNDRVNSLTFQNPWHLNLGTRWMTVDGVSVNIASQSGVARIHGGGGINSYSGTIYFSAADEDTLALDSLYKPTGSGNRTHGFSGGGIVAANGGFDNDGKTINYVVQGNTTLLNNHFMNSTGGNTGSLVVDGGCVVGGNGSFQLATSTVNGAASPSSGGNSNTGIGTLNFNGSLVLNGSYHVDLTGGACDKIVAAGIVLGPSSRLIVTGTATADSYVLTGYATLTGSFKPEDSTLPAGYTVDYDFDGLDQIALVKTATNPDADEDGMADAWENANGLNSSGNDSAADQPDADGLSNLLEYAFGLSPALADNTPLTTQGAVISKLGRPVAAVDSQIHFTFIRRKNAALTGLVYSAEFSEDLLDWTPSAAEPVVVASDANFEAVRVSRALFPGRKGFCRLKVAKLP